jgi:hypothetical protein
VKYGLRIKVNLARCFQEEWLATYATDIFSSSVFEYQDLLFEVLFCTENVLSMGFLETVIV